MDIADFSTGVCTQ